MCFEQYNPRKSMKPRNLFGLSMILSLTGSSWLLIISGQTDWYVMKTSNEVLFIILLLVSILMIMGECIMIVAAFDQR